MYILLSFDIEEFDLPLEYGKNIPVPEQLEIGKRGLDTIMPLLSAHDISCTMYTTAYFATHFSECIKNISEKHEVASHAFYHTTFEQQDLLSSKLKLEEITGKKIYGLRMPRMRKVDLQWVKEVGYQYDSSINPTCIPGRYNNLKLSRTGYYENDFLRLPVSVSPHLRIPLFWLGFKNFPYYFFKKLVKDTLKKDKYVHFYFHPWEFTPIASYSLPWYITKDSGQRLLDKLQRLIVDLKKECEFLTTKDFLIEKKFLTV